MAILTIIARKLPGIGAWRNPGILWVVATSSGGGQYTQYVEAPNCHKQKCPNGGELTITELSCRLTDQEAAVAAAERVA